MVFIKLDDVANGVYDKEDQLSSNEISTTDTPSYFRTTPAYADGQSFASVLTPTSSLWSLFPFVFMILFFLVWMFRKQFRHLHYNVKQKLGMPASVRSTSESDTGDDDGLSVETALNDGVENGATSRNPH